MGKIGKEGRLFSYGLHGTLMGIVLIVAGATKAFPSEKLQGLDVNQLSVILGILVIALGVTLATRAVTRD